MANALIEAFSSTHRDAGRCAELLAQGEPASRNYMVCITPRSGSGWLSDELSRRYHCEAPNEWFNPKNAPNILRKVPTDDLAEYLDILRVVRAAPDGVFGVKASWFQFNLLPQEVVRKILRLGFKYIYLTREDFVQQGVSLFKATRSKIFHSGQYRDTRHAAEVHSSVQYDARRIRGWIDRILQGEYAWERFFEDHSLSPHRLTYESLCSDLNVHLARAAGFVGLQAREAALLRAPRQEKLGSRENLTWSARFTAENADYVSYWQEHRGARRARSFKAGGRVNTSSDVRTRIAELRPWAEAFRFSGVQTVAPKRYRQLEQRTAGRRSIFMDPMIKSGALEAKSVLDLGCNAGLWSLAALEGGARFVTGVDTDEKRIDQARFVMQQHGIADDRYELVYGDGYEYLASNEGFDVVLFLGLFYHIEDPMRLMRLMRKATRELAIIDTVVSNAPQASVSIRACPRKKRYLDVSNIGLEFVSSPKATHWMALEAGFDDVATLEYQGERIRPMRQYLRGERRAFVAARTGVNIGQIFGNISQERYLHPREDHERCGQSPEKRGVMREDERPAVAQPASSGGPRPLTSRLKRFWPFQPNSRGPRGKS